MKTLNLVEAAALLKIHPNTLAALAAKGKAPAAKIGRAWAFIEEDLAMYIRERYIKEAPCRSTSRRAAKSGGSISGMLVDGYVALLEKRIAAKRRSGTTRSR
jgi:excisionase family DNA binding protein